MNTGSNSRRTMGLVSACLLLGFCASVVAQNHPALLSYSPTQGTQGATVTLTFTGANFSARSLRLLFTPSQGLTVASVTAVSGKQIVAQVQIASTATVGSYQVDLQDADHDMIAAIPFKVVAAQQPPPPACPGGIAANGACGAPAPVIKEMSPLSGKQGTTVLLTLNGANFVANESLQLTPPTGLTVGPATLVNANEVQTQITIAASAPLGPRTATLLTGNLHIPAPNTFTVTPGYAIVSESPMQILRLVPSQIVAGSQNVDIAIEGTNFQPGTLVTFSAGAGIPAGVMAMGPARYVNSTEIHVLVSALDTALPGGRDITLQTPQGLKVTAPRMLNVIAPTVTAGPPPALKIMPINLQNFPMGKIVLDTPKWGDQYEGETQQSYGIPVLDDSVQFSWHEQNPGIADYYVLNIYLKDGVTLLASERINGIKILAMGGNQTTVMKVPNYYDPDAAFLASALEPSKFKMAPAGFHYSSHSTPTPVVINGVMIYRPPAPSSSSPQLAEGDLQWEVVGYHTYNTSGVAPQAANPPTKSGSGQSTAPNYMVNSQNLATQANQQATQPQTTDIEVEVSDRWPLNRPDAPTGMSCPASGFGNGLDALDIDSSGGELTYYAGDRFVVAGNFDLTNSPYATNPNLIYVPGSKKSGQVVGQVGQLAFDNLFIDWGDGSVQKITAVPNDSSMTNWSRGETMNLPAPNSKSTRKLQLEGIDVHTYNNPVSYIIRIFQLSEADAQHVNASLLGASVDGPGGSPFLQAATVNKLVSLNNGGGATAQGSVGSAFQSVLADALTPVLSKNGNASSSSGSSPPPGPDLSAITSRAYMIFCANKTLTVPEDQAADGQLHLKTIADPDFPGHDNKQYKIANHQQPAALGNLSNQSAPAPLHVEAPRPSQAPSSGKPEVAIEPQRPGSGNVTADATCSTCDDAAVAQSVIGYYGQGEVQVTWHVDGDTMQQTFALGPSQQRKMIAHPQPGQAEPPIIVSDSPPYSPDFDTPSPLLTKTLGMHTVSVEAVIAPEPTLPNLSIGVRETLSKITASSGTSIDPDAVSQAQSLLNTLSPPAGSNLPPLKVGVLSSSNQSAGGLGAVQYVNGPLDNLVKHYKIKLPADCMWHRMSATTKSFNRIRRSRVNSSFPSPAAAPSRSRTFKATSRNRERNTRAPAIW